MKKALALLTSATLLGCGVVSPQSIASSGTAVAVTPTPVTVPTSQPVPIVRTPKLTARQTRLLKGARSTVGDRYDAGYYSDGPPPKGLGACTDVIYAAFKADNLNLQSEMEKDIAARPTGYPSLRDRNIDYRWAPNQIVWFGRHMKALPKDGDFQAGDVVYWSLLDDGVADHCGIISDRTDGGQPLVIHNFPPACREDRALHTWPIVGHFRRP